MHPAIVRGLTAVAAVVLVALLLVPAVGAADLPRLSDQVVDETGAFSPADIAAIRAAQDRLAREDDVHLYVLLTDSTGGAEPGAYTQAVAQANGLGARDGLLTIALRDRTYYLWVGDGVPLTNDGVDQLLADDLQPGLRAGEYATAVTTLLDGMRATLGAAATATARPTSAPVTAAPVGSDSGSGDAGSGLGGVVLMVLAVVAGVVGATLLLAFISSRRQRGRAAAADTRSEKELAGAANSGLLELDDLVGDMENEAGFAEAEFGAEAAAPLRKALGDAKQELAAAFAVRQKLDDAIPEDDATRRRMLQEIVDRTGRATASLDAQRTAVANLRAIEERTPEILDALPAKADALDARYAAAESTLARVEGAYAEAVWKPVDGNLAEATKRVAVVRDARERGKQALTAGDSRTATQLAVASELALSEVDGLLGAVERMAQDADGAKAGITGVLAEVGADLASAKAALWSTAPGSALPGRVAALEASVAAIDAQVAVPRPDVIDAYRKAAAAAQEADAILAGIRGEAERTARERATLDMYLQAADRDVRRANDFIAARRAGVDREARTRLAEAQRRLDSARSLASSNVTSATQEARAADSLAQEAMALASTDFTRYDRTSWQGPRPPAAPAGGGGIDLGSVLTGIAVASILSGGGRGSGGGFAGTPWGSPAGPVFGGPGGGHGGGGVFGGPGGGGGHGGGGSFGGGGHGGGGGW